MGEMNGSFHWGNGRAKFLEYWFEGMHMVTAEFLTETSFTMQAKSDVPHYMIIFCLDGQMKLVTNSELKTSVQLNEQQAVFLPAALYAVELELLQYTKTVFIQLTENCLNRLNLKDRSASRIDHPTVFGILPTMKMILHSIWESNYPIRMKRIFLESKILELLLLQLDLQSSFLPTQPNIPIPLQDVARIQHARELIEQNIRTPGSLMDLSRKVGLNDFKLKKGFKALLGFTVFGYLHELRMEQARKMLLEKKAVNHVAYEVGYKNPHHFSAAFKRKYGVVPSRLHKH